MSCEGNSCGGKNCSGDATEAFKASENDVIEIANIPTLPTKRCHLIAILLGLSLSYGNYLIAFLLYLKFDYFIAGGGLLLGFILFGIIVSKLRALSIPISNSEFSYSDKEVATWYLFRHYC